MLRSIIFIGTLFISFSLTFGQITFGPKAGINLANWTTEGHNSITAFQAGAVAQFPIGDDFSIQTELLYEGKGTGLSNFIPNNPMLFTLKYVTMNALLGYKIRGVTLMLGPYVSNLLESKLEVNGKEVKYPDGLTPVEEWDWGIASGATLDITPGFGFEVLYYFGFPNVIDISFGDQNGNLIAHLGDGMNRVLQLGAYYKFNSE